MEIILFVAIGYAVGAATFAPLWVKAKKEAANLDWHFNKLYENVKADALGVAKEIKDFEEKLRKAL